MAKGSPLPLAHDGSGRFLPWLIALMVFLAAVATGAAFAIGGALERWDAGLQGVVTVQLPVPAGDDRLTPDRIDQVLAAIRQSKGVRDATLLDGPTTGNLLKPWLGDRIDPSLLPLPSLVDVRLADGAVLDRAALQARLESLVPGAAVEQRGAWLDRLFYVAHLIELSAGAVVLMIGLVAMTAVVFTTRTGLALHAALIDLLHLMGASDGYIARQFQWHAFRLGLTGGLLGLMMSLIAFGGLKLAAEQGAIPGAGDLMPGLRLPLPAWGAILVLPLAMGLVGLVTARITVLRTLARMP
jgi:cell division transport system permease protein